MERNDAITHRIYYKAEFELTSPLMLGGGNSENTDIDLVKNWEGKPFIPATSIAGCFRHYLTENIGKDNAELLFGKDKTSLITLYDSDFEEDNIKILKRDGIALDYDTKTVKKSAKYDYEIIDAGNKFILKFEVLFRKSNEKEIFKLENILSFLFESLKAEKISLGAKTRRGLGNLKLVSCNHKKLKFPDDVVKWLDFDWNNTEWDSEYKPVESISTPLKSNTTLSAEFKIHYSILIKHYNDDPSGVDSVHIQSNGKSVIPGTSWNGAIRHAVSNICQEIGVDFDTTAKKIFGFTVDKTDKKNKQISYGDRHKASSILIKESIIDGGSRIVNTRNKIDRFTGGTVDGALFDCEAQYNGRVKLNIVFLQEANADNWKIGLLLLALKDLGNGIQSIGGEANIGRGILEIESLKLNSLPCDEKIYLSAFAQWVKIQGGSNA